MKLFDLTLANLEAAFRRAAKRCEDPAPMMAEFYAKGWTYRSAAEYLGVHHGHLHRVVIGHRDSPPLAARISALPDRSDAIMPSRQEKPRLYATLPH